ncbi:MAG: GvpL/GvpF family gas vesicle protein [Thermoleophilaceae bacterium]
MIELYAITDDTGPPLPAVAPLRAVAIDGLAVVCAPSGSGELSPEALWRHEEVVEALMEDRDLLPVRYGTRVDDDAAAAHVLEERHDDLLSALELVRGAVELSLRVQGDPVEPADPAPGDSGAEYLRSKASSAAARESAVHGLHAPLERSARASARRPARAPAELLRASYLVDREAVHSFVGDVAQLQRANPGLRLLCTGPWPPYSFTQQ